MTHRLWLSGMTPRLWLFALTDVTLGLVLLVGAPARTSAPSFAVAKQVLPIHTWGALLLAVGLTVIALRLSHQRAVVPLCLGGAYYLFWLGTFALAGALNPAAALTALPPYAALAWGHYLLASEPGT